MKRDLTKIFIDEIYSKPSMRNYPTKKIVYNNIDELWGIDLANFSDYIISNKKKDIDIYLLYSINFPNFHGAYLLKLKTAKQLFKNPQIFQINQNDHHSN